MSDDEVLQREFGSEMLALGKERLAEWIYVRWDVKTVRTRFPAGSGEASDIWPPPAPRSPRYMWSDAAGGTNIDRTPSVVEIAKMKLLTVSFVDGVVKRNDRRIDLDELSRITNGMSRE